MRGEVDARSAAGEGAYPQKQATSSRFYDPGASPLPFFFPGTNPGERSAAGRFRLYVIRTASRQAANPSARAACDLVSKRTTPAHTPGGAPRRRQACAVRAAFAAVSVPGPFPINRRCAGFHLALVPAMAASYGGLPVVGAGRSTGASREWLARPSAGAASAPSWKRLPEDALTERT